MLAQRILLSLVIFRTTCEVIVAAPSPPLPAEAPKLPSPSFQCLGNATAPAASRAGTRRLECGGRGRLLPTPRQFAPSPPLFSSPRLSFFLRLSFSPPSLSFQSPSMVPHPHRFFFLQALVVGRASAALTATRMTQGVRMRLGRSLSYGNLQFEAAHGASCGCTECAPNAHPDGCFCSGCRSEKGHGITCPCSDCNGSARGYAMHGL